MIGWQGKSTTWQNKHFSCTKSFQSICALGLYLVLVFCYPILHPTLLWTAQGWHSLHLPFSVLLHIGLFACFAGRIFVFSKIHLKRILAAVYCWKDPQDQQEQKIVGRGQQKWPTQQKKYFTGTQFFQSIIALGLCLALVFCYPTLCPTLLWTAWGWDGQQLPFSLPLHVGWFACLAGRIFCYLQDSLEEDIGWSILSDRSARSTRAWNIVGRGQQKRSIGQNKFFW